MPHPSASATPSPRLARARYCDELTEQAGQFHETVVHRADACLATRTPFTVAPEVAADCVEEWLGILVGPLAREEEEGVRTLRDQAGKSLRLRATDAGAERSVAVAVAVAVADWLVEPGPEGITWSREAGTSEATGATVFQ